MMKGFVPVTKQSLLDMLEECAEAIELDYTEKFNNRIDLYKERETAQINTRKWYRLFFLPKARFEIDNLESIVEYSKNRYYESFSGCPLETLISDKNNSLLWVIDLARMASSEYSGEPILIDIKTFNRLSNPFNYHWASIGFCYTVT